MKITRIITETKEVEVIDDILCNKCGESCRTDDFDFGNMEGLVEVAITGGYNSQYIGDMTQYTFSVCEKCLMDFVGTFKIPAEVVDFLNSGEIIYNE